MDNDIEKKMFNGIMVELKKAELSDNDEYVNIKHFIKDNNLTLEQVAVSLLRYREAFKLITEGRIIISNVDVDSDKESITYYVVIPYESEYKLTGRDLILAFKECLMKDPLYEGIELHIAYVSDGKWTKEDIDKARLEMLDKLSKYPLYPFGDPSLDPYVLL